VAVEVRYNFEKMIIESVLKDNVTLEDLTEEVERCATLCKEHNCAKMLSDFSNATLCVSLINAFDLPDIQEKRGVERGSMIALLPPKSEKDRSLLRFYETVSFNRGWTTKSFQNREDALDWLLQHT
jgi:hypothetical protein